MHIATSIFIVKFFMFLDFLFHKLYYIYEVKVNDEKIKYNNKIKKTQTKIFSQILYKKNKVVKRERV